MVYREIKRKKIHWIWYASNRIIIPKNFTKETVHHFLFSLSFYSIFIELLCICETCVCICETGREKKYVIHWDVNQNTKYSLSQYFFEFKFFLLSFFFHLFSIVVFFDLSSSLSHIHIEYFCKRSIRAKNWNHDQTFDFTARVTHTKNYILHTCIHIYTNQKQQRGGR